MAGSTRLPLPAGLAALLPLVALFGGLLILWSLSILWLRTTAPGDALARQVFPLLLWVAAIALWIVWQRPGKPAAWLGLLPIGGKALIIAAIAFALMFAWHATRVSLGRMPGELLMHLPPEIYVFMLGGILINEVLFHGILQTRLTELFGPKFSIPVTGLAILAFRIPSFYVVEGAPAPEPVLLASIFLLSLLAGILRHVSRSLWPAVTVQWANALGALL